MIVEKEITYEVQKELFREGHNHYSRGLRHGRLNIFNPGMLFGQDRDDYMNGFKRGRLGYND